MPNTIPDTQQNPSMHTGAFSRVPMATLLLAFVIFSSACDSNDPDPNAGESEVITLVVMTLENEATNAITSATAEFSESGALISVGNVNITAGQTYGVTMSFRNDISNEDLTVEIEDENEFHQLLYSITGSASTRTNIANRDLDSNGDPLGLEFTLTDTGSTTSSGAIVIRLRHYEEDAVLPQDKVNDDGSVETPGVVENDINVTFPLSIFQQA